MRMYRRRSIVVALFAMLTLGAVVTPAPAETGAVSVVFTKGGFIVGVGAGEGVLTFRGKNYPFTVSGASIGFTVGASTTKLVGRALNLRSPTDIVGQYGRSRCRRCSGCGCGWRSVTECQRCHPSAQRSKGWRGIVGRHGRGYHRHAMIELSGAHIERPRYCLKGAAFAGGISAFEQNDDAELLFLHPLLRTEPESSTGSSLKPSACSTTWFARQKCDHSSQTITMPISPGTPPGKSTI